MNRTLALESIAYAALLASISFLVYRKAPEFGQPTLLIGLSGAALSALWGVLVLAGYRHRWWMTLTLTLVGLALLSQAVTAWLRPVGDANASSPIRLVAVAITVLLILSVGLLMNFIHGQGRLTPPPPTTPSPRR